MSGEGEQNRNAMTNDLILALLSRSVGTAGVAFAILAYELDLSNNYEQDQKEFHEQNLRWAISQQNHDF